MNAVLDYDTLEMIGSALREAKRREVKEPLSDDLLALCRRLETADERRGAEITRLDAVRAS